MAVSFGKRGNAIPLGKKEVIVRKNQQRQSGQGLVEYALSIALVAMVVIAILVLMGPQIGNSFSTITHGL